MTKSKTGICSECEQEKELTVHGTCWKCHLKNIRFNARIEARLPDDKEF